MGASDEHPIDKECLGELIGNLGRLYDPTTADAWVHNPGLNRTIEGEIIPRLMMLFDRQVSGAAPAIGRPPGVRDSVDLTEFVRLVLTNDVDVICDYVRNLRDAGEPLASIYLTLLAPAARELGAMWERDECTFTGVTLGVSRMHQVLLRFSSCFCANSAEDEHGDHSALIIPVPGEQHTFGLIMLVEFFRREGWNVWSGSPDRAEDLPELLESGRFDVVGCSISAERHLDGLHETIRLIRKHSKNKNIKVIVGGRLFNEQPELADSVDADAAAGSGTDAVRLAEQLVGRQR